MSFFHKKKKKMSQNVWATIMPFGPVTNILLAQTFFFGPAKGWPSFQTLKPCPFQVKWAVPYCIWIAKRARIAKTIGHCRSNDCRSNDIIPFLLTSYVQESDH
jgi:hypothetical protein